MGIYHHVERKRRHRYLAEFDFRYNARGIKDGERAELVIISGEGKRLQCRDSLRELNRE